MTSKKQELEKQNTQVSNTTMKIFAKKFNNAYGELFGEQKELLSKFISSFKDNGLELKMFLNEEIASLKKEVTNSMELEEIKHDSDMVSKSENVLKLLENLKGQYITENILVKVLKVQKLINEIKLDGK